MQRVLFAPGGVPCSTKSTLEVYRLQELWSAEYLSICQRCCQYLFWQEHGLVHHNASGSGFISVILITTLPGALSRLNLSWLHAYGFAKNALCVYFYCSAKLDSRKIISGAAFCITGLTKIPKIEFLPLDWIYRSIRIMTVSHSWDILVEEGIKKMALLLLHCLSLVVFGKAFGQVNKYCWS